MLCHHEEHTLLFLQHVVCDTNVVDIPVEALNEVTVNKLSILRIQNPVNDGGPGNNDTRLSDSLQTATDVKLPGPPRPDIGVLQGLVDVGIEEIVVGDWSSSLHDSNLLILRVKC